MNSTQAPNGSNEREIFLRALEKTETQDRIAFLETACSNDASLRARLELLLATSKELGKFLEEPAGSVTSTDFEQAFPQQGRPALDELKDEKIGRYRILERAGEGGCGVVYIAEQQQPLRRRVALKIIKLGMDTKRVVARFEAERQALAVMDHPNIAKVLDGGATERAFECCVRTKTAPPPLRALHGPGFASRWNALRN